MMTSLTVASVRMTVSIDTDVAWPSVQVPAIGFASIHRPKAVQERLHRSGRGAEGGRLRTPSPYRR
jgi:hypothetical protein